MRIVSVIFGAAADAKTQCFRDTEVVPSCEIVVIAVIDLERVEAVPGILRQPLVVLHQPRVRQ